ncbi:MAG: hypothetical protein NEHIOOID_00296 [Holosporales bacterium]
MKLWRDLMLVKSKRICLMFLLPSLLFGKGNYFVQLSTSASFLSNCTQAHIQSNQRGAFVKNKNHQGSPNFSAELGFGLKSIQGQLYVDGQLYFVARHLKRTLYEHIKKTDVEDRVQYHQHCGIGFGGRFGFVAATHFIPFAAFGLEYAPHSLTYCAKNAQNQDSLVIKHKSPFYTVGLGAILKLNDDFALSLESQYKTARSFDVLQLPSRLKGYPSLAGARLYVSNKQWGLKIGLIYHL